MDTIAQVDERARFIERITSEREERMLMKAQTKNVIALQSLGRGVLSRRRFAKSIRYLYNKSLCVLKISFKFLAQRFYYIQNTNAK